MTIDRITAACHAAKSHVLSVAAEGADLHGSLCSLSDVMANGHLAELGALSDDERAAAHVYARQALRIAKVL
jgi:hypothetical protein